MSMTILSPILPLSINTILVGTPHTPPPKSSFDFSLWYGIFSGVTLKGLISL